MSFEWLWRFAGRAVGPRDGQGLSLEAINADLPGGATAALPAGPVRPVADRSRRDGVEARIAAKLLGAHLANRHQTSYPLTLDFGSLSPAEGDVLVDFVAAALAADGIDDPERTRRAGETLRRIGASAAQVERLQDGGAVTTNDLVAAARRHDKSAHAYAVSLLTVGSRSTVGQLYLTYLAARLGLTQQVAGSLSRRFRG